MKIKTQVESNKTVFTYAYLYIAANNALIHAEASEHAEVAESGLPYDCMSVVLFCAFTLEAYLNHLGKERFPSWETIEKKLGPHEKLALLLDTIKHSVDKSRQPFQTFKDIFSFRDRIAHGKTEELTYSGIQLLRATDRPREPEVEWLEYCTLSNARRCLENTRLMVTELHERAGLSGTPFLIVEQGSYGASVIPDETEIKSKESPEG